MKSLAQTSSTKWHNERASLSSAVVSGLTCRPYLVNAQKLSTVTYITVLLTQCQQYPASANPRHARHIHV